MRNLTILLLAAGGLLTGCAAYDVPVTQGGAYYESRGPYYSSGPYYGNTSPYYGDSRYYYGDRDRDRDGVPDRQDRSPDDARRY
jgi:hypothetical protein